MSFLVGNWLQSPGRPQRLMITTIDQPLPQIILVQRLQAPADEAGRLPAKRCIGSQNELEQEARVKIAGAAFALNQPHTQIDILVADGCFDVLDQAAHERIERRVRGVQIGPENWTARERGTGSPRLAFAN